MQGSHTVTSSSVLRALHVFMSSWRFPVTVLTVLVLASLASLAMLFVPAGDEGLAAFATEFKTWCFGYDPATGEIESVYAVMMVLDPLLLALVLVVVWWQPLRDLGRTGVRRAAGYVAVAALFVAGAASAFTLMGRADTSAELPFPAERLRTQHVPPAFELTDHAGAPTSLRDLEGRVVVLTGVYATCGNTCPMLLGQAKRAVAALTPEDRDDVTFVAITLDPERDTPERLAVMAEAQGVDAPLFRLCSGDPGVVNQLLDDLGVARERNPETGMIDHANLFLVLDRQGKIAYRFTLGDRQERWLASAIELLVREDGPTT